MMLFIKKEYIYSNYKNHKKKIFANHTFVMITFFFIFDIKAYKNELLNTVLETTIPQLNDNICKNSQGFYNTKYFDDHSYINIKVACTKDLVMLKIGKH